MNTPPRPSSSNADGFWTGWRALRRGMGGGVVVPLLCGVLAAALALLFAQLGARSVAGSWPVASGLVIMVGTLAALLTHCHLRWVERHRCKDRQLLERQLDTLDEVVMLEPVSEPVDAHLLGRLQSSTRQADLLREIADGVRGVEAVFDVSGGLTWISPSIEALTGLTPSRLCASPDPLELLVHDADLAYCRKVMDKVRDEGGPEEFEMRMRHADGGMNWVSSLWRRIERDGRAGGLRLSAENVQGRKEAEYKLLETVAELRRSQALREHYLSRSNEERLRLQALLNVIRLGILFMDRDHRVLYYNRAMLSIWGFAPDENLIGVRDVVLQHRVAPLLEAPERYFNSINGTIGEGGAERFGEISFKDGRVVTDASGIVRDEEGRGIGRVWIYEDVTEQRRTAERLVQLAERDPLTDLYNRRRFHEELERVLADARRRQFQVGLLMFDLDGFKPVNDRFGHQAGDEVLVTIARRVGSIIRRNETFFRLGGDEFAVLVPDADAQELEELARRIIDGVAALEFGFGGERCGLTASLGISLYPLHAIEAERLVAAADQAMYQSKSDGRNRWSIATCDPAESARMSASDQDEPKRGED